MNNEDKESKEAANENQHEDAGEERIGKLQVIRIKNEKYEEYKMSTGHVKRNGWTKFLFLLYDLTPPRLMC